MPKPDFAKMADISRRLEEASKKPDYSMDVFLSYSDEAKEACGDSPELLEFLGPYLPLDG